MINDRSIELKPGNEQAMHDVLEKYENTYKKDVEVVLDDLLKNAEASGIQVYRDLSRVGVLSLDELKMEMHERGVPIGKIVDIISGRIIVDRLSEIEPIMADIETRYRENILQKTNKFATPDAGSPYRAVHYILKLDEHVRYELQIKTSKQLVMEEIYRDAVLKDLYGFDQSVKDEIIGRYWGINKQQLDELMNETKQKQSA